MNCVTDQSHGRVTVVTGAASGMGLAIGQRLAGVGHRVALLDRDGAAAEKAAEQIRSGGATALALAVDVSDRAQVDEAMNKVRSEYGPIEILVTSAGIDEFVKFTEITLD